MNEGPSITLQDSVSKLTTASERKVDAFLDAALTRPCNTIFVAREGLAVPALMAFTKSNLAVVYYLANDETAGFRSFNSESSTQAVGDLEFHDHFSEVSVNAAAIDQSVISIADLRQVIREFSETNALPTCISWFAL